MSDTKLKAVGLEEEGLKAVGLTDDAPRAYPKDTLFKTYNCTVRLGGDLLHEAQKRDVTAKTIRLLQAIHGVPMITNIVEVGEILLNETEHYYELALDYSKTMNPRHGVKNVEQVFGVNLSGFTNWYNNRMLDIDSHREMVNEKKNTDAALISAGREKGELEAKAGIAGVALAKLSPVKEAISIPEVAQETPLPATTEPDPDPKTEENTPGKEKAPGGTEETI